jgi:3-phosphoshikimate 1-carboxyvinyltransferase
MDKIIHPAKRLRANIKLPGDSPISHRAAILASISNQSVTFKNFATDGECQTTIKCLQQLGVEIEKTDEGLLVHGKGLAALTKPEEPLDVCGSVPTARMICGLLSSLEFETELKGCDDLANIPMRRVIEPLELMGAEIDSNKYRLPLKIKGSKLKGIRYAMPIATAQIKAMLLLAGLLADGEMEIIERIPSRDHFERLLAFYGIKMKKTKIEPKPVDEDPLIKRFKKETGIVSPDLKGEMIAIRGGQQLNPKSLSIPGDISSAAYFLIAGLLVKDSVVRVENVSLNPTRLGFVDVLKKMKAPIKVEPKGEMGFEPYGDIEISDTPIKGRRMVGELIPSIIDELPIMSIVAASATGTSVIRDAYELRLQKVDRIKSIATNLRKMGMKVGELDDGMAIDGGGELEGAELESFGDPIIAMTFAIAGLIANSPSVIKGTECVDERYPGFWNDFDKFISGELAG